MTVRKKSLVLEIAWGERKIGTIFHVRCFQRQSILLGHYLFIYHYFIITLNFSCCLLKHCLHTAQFFGFVSFLALKPLIQVSKIVNSATKKESLHLWLFYNTVTAPYSLLRGVCLFTYNFYFSRTMQTKLTLHRMSRVKLSAKQYCSSTCSL